MADIRDTQAPIEVVKSDPGAVRDTQAPVEAITAVLAPPIRDTQAPVEAVMAVLPPPMRLTQFVVEIIGTGLFEDDSGSLFINV